MDVDVVMVAVHNGLVMVIMMATGFRCAAVDMDMLIVAFNHHSVVSTVMFTDMDVVIVSADHDIVAI